MFTPAPFQNQIPATANQENNQQPQTKEQTPKNKTSSSKDEIGTFINTLTGVAGYLHELQVQAHLIHLNYEAGNFLPVHKFLKKQYELHLKQFDDVGELIRSMDYLLPMCHEGLMDASPKFDHVKSYKADEMLISYYKNLEKLGILCKKVQATAKKLKAIDIENYMAELCGDCFKSAWMIKATLRNQQ
tara:strand:- start:419 stop:982 length:564 start_codon:yes stop_codon:yes gene_type:complete